MKKINDFKGFKTPLKTQDSGNGIYIVAEKDIIIATIQGDLSLPILERKEQEVAQAKVFAASNELLKELIHLVQLMEPLEQEGKLNIPGLATLNGARNAINKAL